MEEFAKEIETKMTSSDRTTPPFNWVHFEGRNIDQVVQQIDWLNDKAIADGWRDQLVISVELEKPDREHIDWLMPKVRTSCITTIAIATWNNNQHVCK